jgi:hypothetical protein
MFRKVIGNCDGLRSGNLGWHRGDRGECTLRTLSGKLWSGGSVPNGFRFGPIGRDCAKLCIGFRFLDVLRNWKVETDPARRSRQLEHG